MKTFWTKTLPLTLPFLVLVLVLSSCGKGNKVNVGFKSNGTPKVDIQGIRAHGAEDPNNLDPKAFRDKCLNDLQGKITNGGTVCAVLASSTDLDLTVLKNKAIGPILAGSLVTSSISPPVPGVTVPRDNAEILLDGEHLLNVGETDLVTRDGTLSTWVSVKRSDVRVNVAVWSCYNTHVIPDAVKNPNKLPDHVYCNKGILSED